MAQWFGPKTIGYGFGPRSWQGWLATVVTLAVVIGSVFIPYKALGWPRWIELTILSLEAVAYVALVCLTYEPD